LEGEDMALMLDSGIFYEFIPMSEYRGKNPKAIWLDEVELGVNYALVLNTNAGLWRYIIGDTIKFTSLSPYRFKITGRTKSFINAFGEELMVNNAEKAITVAQNYCNCEVSDFTVAPVYLEGKSKGRHQWAIEFHKHPQSLRKFEEILDLELANCNSDYEAKRKGDLVLNRLEVIPCKEGTFYSWLKTNQKLGGQHKIPKLCNDRELIEQIIAIQNNE
jgi:stage V sporulation protein SpoVS